MQFIYYVSCVCLCGYGSYILISIGYDSTKVGLLISAACILSVIISPIIANLSDKNEKYNIFIVGNIITWIALVLCIISFFQNKVSLFTSISFVLLRITMSIAEPFINAIPSKLEQCGVDIKFGIGRSMGSLSYAIFSTIIGFLTEVYPYQVVYVLNIISYILAIVLYFFLTKDYNSIPKIKNNNEEENNISYLDFIKRHKMFLVICITIIGVYLGYVMVDNLMILIINDVNGTESDMGLILGIKALVEIPVIFFYDKIEAKIPNRILLKIAVIGFAIKSLIVYLAKSTVLLYVAQIFQPFSLALMVPAFVSFINKIMDKKEAVRGQSMFTMMMIISTIIASSVGGKIAADYSVSAMLLFAFIVNVISSVIFCFLIDKCK